MLRSTTTAPSGRLVTPDGIVALDRAVISIGRHPDRDVVLLDPRASRRHAQVVRSANGHRLEDGGSANGTYVNDERVQARDLVDGDLVRIGDTEIRFEGS